MKLSMLEQYLIYFYCLINHQTLLIVTQDKKFNNGMLSKTKCYRDPPWHPLLTIIKLSLPTT